MAKWSPALSLLLWCGALLVYVANGRAIGSGDTLPGRYLPFSVLREHDVDLDEFPVLHDEHARRNFPLLDGIPYFLHYRDGHYRSAYSPGPALLALPVYAGPVLAGVPVEAWAAALEKLSAAAITALSVVCLFWALAGLVARRWALGIAAVYAFGTSSWSVSSQGLWQHGPSQLFVALLLLCLVRGVHDERWLSWAGFAASAATVMRSTDALLALPVFAWIVYTRRHLAPRLVLLALPPLAALALYNAWCFGSVLGRGGSTTAPTWAFFAQAPSVDGALGVLLSPGRGLFIYSPVLVFSIVGGLRGIARGPAMLKPLAVGVVLVVVVVSQWFRWWGGYTWGPRLLADVTPVLCVFLCPLTEVLDRRRLAAAAFVALAVLSVAAHGLGAFFYDARWDAAVEVDRHHGALWSWSGGPLVFYGREAASAAGRAMFGRAPDRPSSANSPALLAGSLDSAPASTEMLVGEGLALWATATNTGRAVWLATPPGQPGAVSLGWRWSRDGVDRGEGRAPLRFEVAPGEHVRFAPRVPVPAVPGDYTLAVGLVSEHVTWFGGSGVHRIMVRPADVDRILIGPLAPGERPPTATISTDRAWYRSGEPIPLTVRLRNAGPPRQFDAYLIGRDPRGAVWFYDGQRLSRLADDRWIPWSRALPMPAQATGQFAIPSSTLVPGLHRWHVLMTESGTYRPVARGATEFTVAR